MISVTASGMSSSCTSPVYSKVSVTIGGSTAAAGGATATSTPALASTDPISAPKIFRTAASSPGRGSAPSLGRSGCDRGGNVNSGGRNPRRSDPEIRAARGGGAGRRMRWTRMAASVAPDDPGRLRRRVAGVVVEDHRRPLRRREHGQRPVQVDRCTRDRGGRRRRRLGTSRRPRCSSPAAILKAARQTHFWGSRTRRRAAGAARRLRDGVVGDRRVGGVRRHRALPEPSPVLAVERLDGGVVRGGRRVDDVGHGADPMPADRPRGGTSARPYPEQLDARPDQPQRIRRRSPAPGPLTRPSAKSGEPTRRCRGRRR